MKSIILETERLILRKPNIADFNDLQEGLDNINIAKCITSISIPYTLDMIKKYFGSQIEKWEVEIPTTLLFVIELKSEEKIIGAIGLHGINHETRTADTGSWINEKYWRNGYMTEAKIAANTFAFNELKLEKLISPVFADNEASNATQKKMGYELIEFKKDSEKCLATGIIHDSNIYELTRAKWKIILAIIKEQSK